MSADDQNSSVQHKEARKAALKAEAASMGISYKELKAQKKENKSRRAREAERLQHEAEDIVEGGFHKSEMKRMRTWSKDYDGERNGKSAPAVMGRGRHDTAEEPVNKRRRTRSMDLHESTAEKPKTTTLEPSSFTGGNAEEWRKLHNITVQGHGKFRGERNFPDPYLKFEEAPFCDATQRALRYAGFEKPTPIQSQAWPIAVKGQDMICIAKTGSGKTCGFLLPSFHQHLEKRGGFNARRSHAPGAGGGRDAVLLVLAPTRELACQIMEETQKFGRPLGLRSVCCYGGSPKYHQIAALDRGVECIVATPGRLNDLLEMKKANLSRIQFVVLDEADRMLDMGFEPQIRSILKHVPQPHQSLLFSATWPREIQQLAHDFLKDPIQINVGEVNSLNANKDIKQNIIMCTEAEKFDKLTEILKDLIGQGKPQEEEKQNGWQRNQPPDIGGKDHPKVIVFVAKKVSCNDLANQLWDDGFAVDSLHGDRQQWERTKVINAFKSGTLRMLIATDVAARGLDVKDVAIVVNYDMPAGTNAAEDYVHRIGRTGRAGAKGLAHTFFTPADSKCATQLVDVMRKAGQEVPDALQALVRPKFGRGGRGGGGRSYMGGRGGRSYMGRGGGRGGFSGRGGRGSGGRGGGRFIGRGRGSEGRFG